MIIDDKLMKYVVFKKRTEMEIRQKCKRLEYTDNYIEEIVEYLKENEYINDERYVEKYINNLMRLKKASVYEIKIDLIKRGVNDEYIDNYVSMHSDELYEFEKDSAKKIVMKKLKTEDIDKVKRYLKNKGYSYDSINEAIDNFEQLSDNSVDVLN